MTIGDCRARFHRVGNSLAQGSAFRAAPPHGPEDDQEGQEHEPHGHGPGEEHGRVLLGGDDHLLEGDFPDGGEDEADDEADEGIVELAHEIGQQGEREHQRHVEGSVLGEVGPHDAGEDDDRIEDDGRDTHHLAEEAQAEPPGEELLAVGKKLRGYVTKGSGVAPDKFIGMFFGGQPITAKEFDALTALRMENTGKVRGVFDVNFDKREFSAVHIMDGWQTWAMRDVSVAAYHATRSCFASADDQWRKLLNHLNGKEITSAGHLSAQNFSFGEEIIESDGKLNFYLQTDFDVDAAFGTFVCTDQNDDWLNIYANYDVEQDRLCNTLDLNLCKGDGSEEDWSYPLNAAEQEVLLHKMEAFCQQQTGMNLHEYAQQLRDSETQAPEMQM